MPSYRQVACWIVGQLCLLAPLSGTAAASPVTGREESAEILRIFEEAYPGKAHLVERRLRERIGPEAKLYLAMLLHWEKSELRIPDGEIADLLAEAHEEAVRRKPSLSAQHTGYREQLLGRLTPYDGTTPSLINHLRHRASGPAFFQVPCRFFLRNPEIGVLAQSVSKDRHRRGAVSVACEEHLKTRLSHVFEIFAQHHPVNNVPCGGTIHRDIRAGQRETKAMLLYSPQDLRWYKQNPQPPGPTLRATSLYAWALQGRWNFQAYQHLEVLFSRAVEELVAYLVETFDLQATRAQQIARLGLLSQLRGARLGPPAPPIDPVRAAVLEGREVDPDALAAYAEPKVVSDQSPWRPLSGHPEPLLFLAVDRPDVVQLLLDQGFEPDIRNRFGKTALMAAAQVGNLDSLRRLLAAGASVNARTLPPERIPGNGTDETFGLICGPYAIKHGRRTALMYAATEASRKIIETLLAAGANPAARDSLGKGAADYLTGQGPTAANTNMTSAERDALAQRLRGLALAAPADIDAPVNEQGQTALHLAVTQGEKESVEQLLRQGADVEIFDGNGLTALALAASQDRTDLMKVLLDAGAQTDAQVKYSFGPLEEAIFAGASRAVGMLLDHGVRLRERPYGYSKTRSRSLYGRLAQPDRLHIAQNLLDEGMSHQHMKRLADEATRADNKDLLLALQDRGLDLSGKTGSRWRSYPDLALHYDQPSALQTLQDLGVDLQAETRGGPPLIVKALANRKLKALQKLLDLGVSPFAGERPETMALFIGVATARPALVDQALVAGGDIDDRLDLLSRRETVVHLALDTRRLGALNSLTSRGADFNARNGVGQTPLTHAASMGLGSDWISALLKAGADPCLLDKHGRSALHEAVRFGAEAMVRSLLRAGVSPDSQDTKGHSALDYAREGPNRPVLRILESHTTGERCLKGTD